MTETEKKHHRILRRLQVQDRTGFSRSSIYVGVKNGTFPSPIRLGEKAVGWIESEIDAWLDARVNARKAGGAR